MPEETQNEPQAVKGPRTNKGLVIVNTGDGKGKTTAALGVLFRAWGRGMRVRMFQFIKHSGAQFGKQRAAKRLGIPIEALGDGFTGFPRTWSAHRPWPSSSGDGARRQS